MYRENLKKIRKELKLSVKNFAEKLDMSASTLTGYEHGTRTPSVNLFIQLYKKLNINLNWFISGDGEMFNTPPFEQVSDKLTQKVEDILRQHKLI